jgi:hypothetical protein
VDNQQDIARAAITALLRFKQEKRAAFKFAQDADKACSTPESAWERNRTHSEYMASIEATGPVHCALIMAGIELDFIRAIEAELDEVTS